ncbi:hypothetical protein EVAR_10426_1 [Eumeta japonica]|uniref:Uncharacterized protein n=1 Tax=Eumeta variegata TaxID=151549 RepID=A0A4C1UCW2_EUMVA|nr:hypothetical protein EVAR_10426_1 [Eumeta japonica]
MLEKITTAPSPFSSTNTPPADGAEGWGEAEGRCRSRNLNFLPFTPASKYQGLPTKVVTNANDNVLQQRLNLPHKQNPETL